jgi:alpha-beta hydrolase superfamily lysophospholipase
MSAPPAQPLYFGPADRTLFGWLHRPAEQKARNTGVVLCSPSGYEAICTHRSYRIVAEEAAARGFPALRFDYDGTGDSGGHGLDGDRVGHWLRSIAIAIDTLKAQSGVDRICVFGVRVGASLAAKAVQGRSDVHAMIAFAPVVKVKSYLREIRALSLAQETEPPPADLKVDPELQEAAGFATTPETRAALAGIDLAALDAAPAAHVLVLERDDLTPSDAWPRRLTALGAAVEQRQLQGYVDMMRDAHASKVPLQSIESALDWLAARDGVVAKPVAAATSPVVTAEFTDEGGKVRESAGYLDEQRILFGVVSEPIEPRAAVRDVVVLLNSGTIHHIGPSRLYVAIARRCAARGMAVLRIDLSGVGDSAVRRGEAENSPYSEGARIDVPAAVKFAQQRFPGAKVHLVGLCSGAYHALKAAAAGSAFRSIVVVNPLTFFWKPGMSLEYADFQVTSESKNLARNAGSLAHWVRLLRGDVNVLMAARVFWKRLQMVARNSMRDVARRFGIGLQDDLASELLRIARNNTDMYFVFSATDPGHTMLREQGGRIVNKLARREQLRISIVHGADHTFTAHWNRDQLITLLMAHLERHAASP